MNWLNAVSNPESVATLYDDVPELLDVVLSEFHADLTGTIRLAILNLPFPKFPPERWQRDGKNAVILRLDVFGVNSLALLAWCVEQTVSVNIARLSEHLVRLTVDAKERVLELECNSISIARVEGYHREASL